MTPKRNTTTTALLQFYDKPVAKVSLELFFTITTVIIFAMFAIRPTLLTMSNLVKELEDKRELNQKLAQKAAALQTLQASYFSLETRLGVLDKAIPSSPKFSEAISIIEKTASTNQLSVLSLTAKEVPKESDPKIEFNQKTRISRPVVASVTGSYPAIRQFVEDLRQSQRMLIVDSVQFSTIEDTGVKRLRANITISIPYFGIDNTKPNPQNQPEAEDPFGGSPKK